MRWLRSAPEICGDLSGAIGNTPLLRLARASARAGATILAKAEFMNPGGSGKDRPAHYILRDAERRGLLRRGGLVVEGTAGPMGISLVLVGRARGYRTHVVMPGGVSPQKDCLRSLGAEVSEAADYVAEAALLAERLAAQEPLGVLHANARDNRANRQSHYETTGPELWRQSGERLDAFVCAVETGGTLAGAGAYLRERRRSVRIVAAEAAGATPHLTGNLVGAHRDASCAVEAEEVEAAHRELLHDEGLPVGSVSALNVAAAVRVGRSLGPGRSVVTLLADAVYRH